MLAETHVNCGSANGEEKHHLFCIELEEEEEKRYEIFLSLLLCKEGIEDFIMVFAILTSTPRERCLTTAV
jgi:hypothetical protein